MPYKDYEKHKECQRKHSWKRRASKARWQREARAIKRDWLIENIEHLKCLDCELPFSGQPWMADFHHLNRDKEKRITRGELCNYGYNKIIEELNKGIFICPNCHRIRTVKGETINAQ
jgi:hypothetical protein